MFGLFPRGTDKVPLDLSTAPLVPVSEPRMQPRSQEQPQFVRHRVKRGETILNIARRYGASVERIVQANGLRKSHLLQVGMTLLYRNCKPPRININRSFNCLACRGRFQTCPYKTWLLRLFRCREHLVYPSSQNLTVNRAH